MKKPCNTALRRPMSGTLPWKLRYAMAYDKELCADVLRAFIDSVQRSLRWRAKRKLGLRSVKDALTGGVTFIQRVDSSLRLNVHFHSVVLDGVYVRDEAGELVFHSLGDPTADEIAQVAEWTHARLQRVLERHGRSLDASDDAPDVLAQEQLPLAMVKVINDADELARLLADMGLGPRPPPRPRPTPPGQLLLNFAA